MNKLNLSDEYINLVENLGNLIDSSRIKVYEAIRLSMLKLYWQIGQYIVEFEQKKSDTIIYEMSMLFNSHILVDLRNFFDGLLRLLYNQVYPFTFEAGIV